ncbi:MAG: glutamate formiminotransferase / formiminotetrahydrofolate cyclodeaminase [Holophagaceae bacterium]|nr:glutamate formiminotransferase / formiminotetrahydrofolate cyclodeaminase [Holophagaceae bacterium]
MLRATGVQRLVECVPNFSEGRDSAKIRLITEAIESVGGIQLLGVDSGADANRTVVTFLGEPEQVLEAAFRGVMRAAEIIDMRDQIGSHPRLGACDVCPFVPIEGVTLEECAELARRLGRRVGADLGIPVYLYEEAATRPERRNLAFIRRGEYEGLAAKLLLPEWAPDFGPATFVPSFGALTTGAREFLIAYNINLDSRDKAQAADIAFELRERGRVARRGQKTAFYLSGQELVYGPGCLPCGNCDFDAPSLEALEDHCRETHGYELRELLLLNDIDPSLGLAGQKVYRAGLFRECRAIGWYVEAYGRAQISINLTRPLVTPPHRVLEAARALAGQRGLKVTGSEIVGLMPFHALFEAGQFYLSRDGRSPHVPVRDVLEYAVKAMGLRDVTPFDVDKKVLGLPRVFEEGPTAMKVADFVTELSRHNPTPGGGAAAALAGAQGAALAAMVANLTQSKPHAPEYSEALLKAAEKAHGAMDTLLHAVDEDTEAYRSYLKAKRMPKETPDQRGLRDSLIAQGLQAAIDVPLRTARASFEAMESAATAIHCGHPAAITDALVGLQMAYGGVRGGLWNALTNLREVPDLTAREESTRHCREMLERAKVLLEVALAEGHQRLDEQLG